MTFDAFRKHLQYLPKLHLIQQHRSVYFVRCFFLYFPVKLIETIKEPTIAKTTIVIKAVTPIFPPFSIRLRGAVVICPKKSSKELAYLCVN